jgi:hypothetical protein
MAAPGRHCSKTQNELTIQFRGSTVETDISSPMPCKELAKAAPWQFGCGI